MSKLLANYRADKSMANAIKLAAYDRKHPMAACLLSVEDTDLLAQAIAQTR